MGEGESGTVDGDFIVALGGKRRHPLAAPHFPESQRGCARDARESGGANVGRAGRRMRGRRWHGEKVATGEVLTYGQLAPLAATLPVPAAPVLTPAASYRIIGTPAARPDAPCA